MRHPLNPGQRMCESERTYTRHTYRYPRRGALVTARTDLQTSLRRGLNAPGQVASAVGLRVRWLGRRVSRHTSAALTGNHRTSRPRNRPISLKIIGDRTRTGLLRGRENLW